MKKQILGSAVSIMALSTVLSAPAQASDVTEFLSGRVCRSGNVLDNTVGTVTRNAGLNSINLDLLRAEILPNLQFSLGYDRNVQRVAETTVYVRRDIYEGMIGYDSNMQNLRDFLDGRRDSLMGFRLQQRLPIRLEYNRFTHDPCVAHSSPIVNPRQMPLDSERALRMNRYEYFKLDASSELDLSADLWQMIGGGSVVAGEIRAGMKLDLSYQAHVLRLDGNKVKLRLLGLRLPELYGQMSVGVVNPIQFTNTNLVDRQITRRLNLDFVNARISQTPRELLNRADLVELDLDLSQPSVREAYDQLFVNFANMGRTTTLQRLQLLNPLRAFRQFQQITDSITHNLRHLAFAGSQAVPLLIDASTAGRQSSLQYGIGYVVGRYRNNRVMTSSLLRENNAGGTSYQNVTNYRETSENRALFNLSRTRHEVNLDVVYDSDATGRDLTLNQIVITTQTLDARLDRNEFQGFMNRVRRNVTPGFYTQAEQEIISTWFGGSAASIRPNSLLARLGFNSEVYRHSELSFQAVIGAGLLQYARRFATVDAAREYIVGFLANLNRQGIALQASSGQITDLANKMYRILDTRLTDRERDQAFQSLSRNAIFVQAGAGVMLGLVDHVPEAEQKRFIGFQITLRAPHLSAPLRVQWTGGVMGPDDAVTRMTDIRSYSDPDNRYLETIAARYMDTVPMISAPMQQ